MDEEFFAECRQAFSEKLIESCQKAAHSDPLLSRIRVVNYHHGMTMTVADVNGIQRVSEFERMGSSFKLPDEILEAGDVEAFGKILNEGAQHLRKQLTDLLFRRVSDAADSVGNVIDLKGKPFSGNDLCDMIEHMHIDFDEMGRPKMPTFVLNPDLQDRVRELLDQPEVQLRLDVILREKWMAKYTLK